MRIPRIFLNTDLHHAFTAGKSVDFDENGRRHAAQVLRLKTGATAVLFDNRGGEYLAELDEVSKRKVSARISSFVDTSVESPLAITLAQGISRGERMDLTLQKATELGITDIVPLITKRCGVHLSSERQAKRLHHWQGIVIAACQQSGRTRVPDIENITSLTDWMVTQAAGDELRLILTPTAEKGLQQIAEKLDTVPARVTLLIGPEGGLEDNEIKLARQHGFLPVALGPRVLRTETAGITAISLLQAFWGDI